VQYVYRVFKERVADGRNLDFNGLDEIANARVWTGAQALEHGLIDATGDFQTAVEMARNLGDLEEDARVRTVVVTSHRKSLLAMPVEAVQALLGVTRLYQMEDLIAGLAGGDLAKALLSERYWLVADDLPRVE
jgi:ClpP class serine protease